MLEEITRIAYYECMEFIGRNRYDDDCMIVAIHNALIAAGKPSTYERVKNICVRHGWYRKGKGFQCKFLGEAFKRFGVEIKPVPEDMTTKEYFRNVVENNKSYFIVSGARYEDSLGHAMVATKGEIGVKIVNSLWYGRGWKTISKDINLGFLKIYAVEIERSI